jgi:predicted transcriptional regulator
MKIFYHSRRKGVLSLAVKLFDAELRVMDVLWSEGAVSAAHIAGVLKQKYDYSKTTTYTLIKRCVDKGAVKRREPRFMCQALVSREDVQEFETNELINKLYGGAADRLVAALLVRKDLTDDTLRRLREIIGESGDSV